MTRITEEMWLQTLLRKQGARADAFEGLTTQAQRRDHFRGVIRGNCLADTPVQGHAFTFARLFQSTYGEPL